MATPKIIRHSEAATTTGVVQILGAEKAFFKDYALQIKGVGAGATSWSVTVDVSLDGSNWTTVLTHNATDGSVASVVDKPGAWIRINVGSLTLGSATAITCTLIAQ